MDSPQIAVLSQQQQLKRRMDVVANNLANLSTTGFKRHLAIAGVRGSGLAVVDQPQATRLSATPLDLRQGTLGSTGNALDMAIEGEGYFQVETAEGLRLTRNGRFSQNPEGTLVTSAGDPMLDVGGAPVELPPDAGAISVAPDGTLTANGRILAQIGVVNAAVASEGDGLFRPLDEPEPLLGAQVRQGVLEASNVSPVEELAEMIEIQRAYEYAARLTQAEHERQQRATQVMGRSA